MNECSCPNHQQFNKHVCPCSIERDSLKREVEAKDAEIARLKGVLEDETLIVSCLKELFFSAMSNDSNTGKVVRLQYAAQKLKFMEESEKNKQLVLNEFRAWKAHRAALGQEKGV